MSTITPEAPDVTEEQQGDREGGGGGGGGGGEGGEGVDVVGSKSNTLEQYVNTADGRRVKQVVVNTGSIVQYFTTVLTTNSEDDHRVKQVSACVCVSLCLCVCVCVRARACVRVFLCGCVSLPLCV
jgi:hypothetical protein